MSDKIELGNRLSRYCSSCEPEHVPTYNDKVSLTYPGIYQSNNTTFFFGDEYTRWLPLVYNTSKDLMRLVNSLWQIDIFNISGYRYKELEVVQNDLGGINIYPTKVPLQWGAVLAVYDPTEEKSKEDPNSNVENNIGHFNFAGYGNYLEWNNLSPVDDIKDNDYEEYSFFRPWRHIAAVVTGILAPWETETKFVERVPGRRSAYIAGNGMLYLAVSATSNFIYPDYRFKGSEYPIECWRSQHQDVAVLSVLYTYTMYHLDQIDRIKIDAGGDPLGSLDGLPLVNYPHVFEISGKTIVTGE